MDSIQDSLVLKCISLHDINEEEDVVPSNIGCFCLSLIDVFWDAMDLSHWNYWCNILHQCVVFSGFWRESVGLPSKKFIQYRCVILVIFKLLVQDVF